MIGERDSMSIGPRREWMAPFGMKEGGEEGEEEAGEDGEDGGEDGKEDEATGCEDDILRDDRGSFSKEVGLL